MTIVHVAIAAIAALLPITNPLGAVAAFSGLTGDMEREQVRRQALRTGICVFAILAVFSLVGSYVLSAFGISLAALQIAGGLVVAHSGFGMIVPRPQGTDAERQHAQTKKDISFSPMALPLIAGPGAIGVVIALQARHPGVQSALGLLVASGLLAAIIWLLLRYGTPLVDRLGATGIGALTRVMGFLILAIGVELLVHGTHAAGF